MGGGRRLKVCERGNPTRCSFFQSGFRGGERDPRTFIAHLPAGKKYDAVFVNPAGGKTAPTEGEYILEESFCSTENQFEVRFEDGPSLVHPVTPDGRANGEDDEPAAPVDGNDGDTDDGGSSGGPLNWFIRLLQSIIAAIFGNGLSLHGN